MGCARTIGDGQMGDDDPEHEDRHRGDVLPLRAPARLTAPALSWLFAHVTPARVSLEAHSDPDAEEPRAVCRDTLAEAHRRQVAVPRLAAAEIYFKER